MVEHRTLNPLVPSSSLGLPITSNLALCGVFCYYILQLNDWNDVVKGAEWQSLIDVQTIYRDAEAVGNFTVFNIKGNKYRLIVSIDYQAQLIYYKYFLTHAQYDKENWKNDDYY
jgi:mRNA interferase HigB